MLENEEASLFFSSLEYHCRIVAFALGRKTYSSGEFSGVYLDTNPALSAPDKVLYPHICAHITHICEN